MLICQNCDGRQLNGTIFCSECGASMLDEAGRARSSEPPATHSGHPQPAARRALDTGDVEAAGFLTVVSSGRRIVLRDERPQLVGRGGDGSALPDVDLGHDDGKRFGVSRQHALIAAEQGRIVVKDLASTNGTFLNGRRLEPQVGTPLRPGDELRFGRLTVRYARD